MPTTGARAAPSCSPTSAEHRFGRRRRPRRAAARRRGTASTVSRQPRATARAPARRPGRPRRGRSRRRPTGGRAAARPRAPGRRPHRCRPGPASGRRRRRRRRCARRARRCWRRSPRRPARRTPSRSPAASGVPCQPRLGASTTVPAASTTPGLPTPMPSTGRVAASTSSRTSCGRGRRRPRRGGRREAGRARSWTVAGEVDQRPGHDPVGRRGRRPTMWRGLGGQPTSTGGLPTRPWTGAADSVEQLLGDQAGDEVGDGHPGQPAGPGQVGPAGRAVAEQQLEQQCPVVATGVLREVLARGAQRPANRGGGRRHVC